MKTHRTKCQKGEARAQGESPGDTQGGPSGTQQGAVSMVGEGPVQGWEGDHGFAAPKGLRQGLDAAYQEDM